MHAQWRGFENTSNHGKESRNVLQEIKNDLMEGVGLEQGIREGVAWEHVKTDETYTLTRTAYLCIPVPLEAQKLWSSQNNYPLAMWLDNNECGRRTSTVLLLSKSWGLPSLKSSYMKISGERRFPTSLLNLHSYWGSVAMASSWTKRDESPEGKSTHSVFNRRGQDSGAAY